MRGTKYLSEMMQDIELSTEKNNLILAPIGSGKTQFIFSHLRKNKKVLYLCDNQNLKKQCLKEDNTYSFEKDLRLTNFDITETYISTYKEFGKRIEFDINDDYISQFDLIVADEIHSLIEYYSFSNDAHLSHVIRFLMSYGKIPIVMFTATQYYLEKLCEKNPQFNDKFNIINFLDDKNIIRYTEKRRCYINNFSQIRLILELKEYTNGFNFMGMKCLIYTKSINDMLQIQELCENISDIDLRPICIWSVSNKEYPMSTEQLLVREHLIQNSELVDPYNVLIINKSSETGLNIKDEDMDLAIINSTNLTEQLQARGRIRKDIDMIAVRTSKTKLPTMTITLDAKYLNTLLTKDELDSIIESFNLSDIRGRGIGSRAFKEILETSGYSIIKQRIYVNKMKKTMYIIK